MKRLTSCVAVTIVSGTSLVSCSHDSTSPVVIFEEVRAWRVEDPSVYTGGAVLDDGSTFVWTRTGDVFNLPADGRGTVPTVVAEGLHPIAFPLRRNGSWISAAVSRVDGSFFRLTPRGKLVPQGTRCPELRTASAVSSTGLQYVQLVAVLEDRSGEGHSIAAFQVSGTNCLQEATAARIHCPRGETPSLASAGPDLTVVLACPDAHAPLYAVHAFGSTLRIHDFSESIGPQDTAFPSQDEPLWFYMPLLRTRFGFLRTTADLQSDRRRFDFWDAFGNHLWTREIDEPIGLIAASPEGRLVLGMRGAPDFAFVLFHLRGPQE